jgi:hypothetical protein
MQLVVTAWARSLLTSTVDGPRLGPVSPRQMVAVTTCEREGRETACLRVTRGTTTVTRDIMGQSESGQVLPRTKGSHSRLHRLAGRKQSQGPLSWGTK